MGAEGAAQEEMGEAPVENLLAKGEVPLGEEPLPSLDETQVTEQEEIIEE